MIVVIAFQSADFSRFGKPIQRPEHAGIPDKPAPPRFGAIRLGQSAPFPRRGFRACCRRRDGVEGCIEGRLL